MNKVLLFFISGVVFISAIFLFTNMKMDDLHADLKDGWEEKNKMKKTIGVGAIAPLDSEILFDGSRYLLDKKWTYWNGPRLKAELPIKWEIIDDPIDSGTVVSSFDLAAIGGIYGAADIVTKEKFKDFRLHVEFLVSEPKGNSGVYLQNRYEIQILDGDSSVHGMGAVINESSASYNNYNGTGKWNAYDIKFRAARFSADSVVEKPIVTMYFNSNKVHSNVHIEKVWGGPNSGLDGGKNDGYGISNTPGGIKLQSEGFHVLYRNIWIQKLDIEDPDTDF
tara:strand:+ start:1752 stop:2588 length:837 start_codon:yes stop_codon:yes gene_type:complete